MKKLNGIIWGLVLITIGVIIAGNSLNIFSIDLFFDGWWTLFIIIPCTIGLITDKEKTGSLIGLIVGILLLCACQNIIDFDVFWKVLVPVIIIIIGIKIIFKTIFGGKICENYDELSKKIGEDKTITAVFSGQTLNANDQEFKGSNLSAIFGSIELDLRNAIIKEDVVINASAVFGGIELLVNDDINVVLKSNSVFGGADNKTKNSKKDKKHTIYINATCIFGGLEVK